jgi:hypothetical protein
MRIKFKKGITPEGILQILEAAFDAAIIGAVNVYIQRYDEHLKQVKSDGDCFVVDADPNDTRYDEYIARQLRKRMKVI